MRSLNELLVTLSRDIESRDLSDSIQLVKQVRRAEYLALSLEQQHILARFKGVATVQEVLHGLLKEGKVTKIRGFYDLVAHAMDKGFLEVKAERSSCKGLTGCRWKVGMGLFPAILFSGLAITLGGMVLYGIPLTLLDSPLEWFAALIFFMLGLSLANLLAGLALSGAGREVYRARIRWNRALPFFSVDTRDAFMGGRTCEAAVALMKLSSPFLMVLVATAIGLPPLLLAAQGLALLFTMPFGSSPMHDLLYALLRREHQLPRFAGRFFRPRLISQIFQWRTSLAEDRYLFLHSTYTILWLGLVFHAGVSLLDRYGSVLVWNLSRAGAVVNWLESLVGFFLLVLAVPTPLGILLWMLLKAVWKIAAAHFFRAEAFQTRGAGKAGKPSDDILLKFLKNTLLFSQLPDGDLPGVLSAMRFVSIKSGGKIIREGDIGDKLFVLYRGMVEVLREDESGAPQRVATLGPGDVFGEIALLDKMRRTSSVRSLEKTDLLVLSRNDFHRLLTSSLGAEQIRTLVQVCAFLHRNPLFADWHSQALVGFSKEFIRREIKVGERIIEEGKSNESFYLIHQGHFEVRRGGKSVAVLQSGEFCGEISLLKKIPATADVVALEAGHCLQLGKETFLKFVSQNFATGFAIESAIESRLKGKGS